MENKEFRIRVKDLRKHQGMTQEKLAERMQVSRQSIIAIESGACKPSLPLALDLANLFDTSIEYLLGLNNIMSTKGDFMPSIIPWSPLHDMRDAIDKMMDEASSPRTNMPSINVHQTEKQLVAEVYAPGYKEDEIDVEIGDGVLTITGKKEEEKEDKNKQYLHREWTTESFTRSIALPDNVSDDGQASYEDGVVKIKFPKIEPEKPKMKKLKVNKK